MEGGPGGTTRIFRLFNNLVVRIFTDELSEKTRGKRQLKKLFEELSQKQLDKLYFMTIGSPASHLKELRKIVHLGGIKCSVKTK